MKKAQLCTCMIAFAGLAALGMFAVAESAGNFISNISTISESLRYELEQKTRMVGYFLAGTGVVCMVGALNILYSKAKDCTSYR